jgi:hypothetical protein
MFDPTLQLSFLAVSGFVNQISRDIGKSGVAKWYYCLTDNLIFFIAILKHQAERDGTKLRSGLNVLSGARLCDTTVIGIFSATKRMGIESFFLGIRPRSQNRGQRYLPITVSWQAWHNPYFPFLFLKFLRMTSGSGYTLEMRPQKSECGVD